MNRTVTVECWRGGQLIASYDSVLTGTLAAPPPAPDKEQLINDAKTQLTNDRLAFPPYTDIEFRIRSN